MDNGLSKPLFLDQMRQDDALSPRIEQENLHHRWTLEVFEDVDAGRVIAHERVLERAERQ